MKGRKTIPSNIHKLRGTFRGDRHKKPEDLEIKSVLPEPPEWFTNEVAKKEWKRMSKELHDLGVLTALDLACLEMYCVVYARWIRAEMEMEKEKGGEVAKTPNGYKQQSAWLLIANNCITQMRGLASEFGFTPAVRARIDFIKQRPRQMDLMSLLEQVTEKKVAENG